MIGYPAERAGILESNSSPLTWSEKHDISPHAVQCARTCLVGVSRVGARVRDKCVHLQPRDDQLTNALTGSYIASRNR